jgi:hypothetical protein
VTVRQLFIHVDFKKTYDSAGRKILYNILIEVEVPMKLARLNIICLNKYLSSTFPIQNRLKQGDALSPLLSTLLQNMP